MRLAAMVDDSPQLRIALALIVALIVWAVVLFQLGRWLSPTQSAHAPEKPLEMQMVELDPPQTPQANPSAAADKPTTSTPVTPAKPRQSADPHARALPQPHATPPAPSKPEPQPQPQQSAQSIAPAQTAPAAAESSPAPQPPARPANPRAEEKTATTSSGDTNARAIAQPLPELPDDLRDQAYQTVATARFMIHADGSVDVELVKPTPIPRLNQILLEALRKWRFFPAMQTGHPVESRQDIRVHFNVN